MEELKSIAQESHVILKRVDERIDSHGKELRLIREGMANVKQIADNTGKMASALERVTDRAMTALEKENKREGVVITTVIVILGILLLILMVSFSRTDFTAHVTPTETKVHAGVTSGLEQKK